MTKKRFTMNYHDLSKRPADWRSHDLLRAAGRPGQRLLLSKRRADPRPADTYGHYGGWVRNSMGWPVISTWSGPLNGIFPIMRKRFTMNHHDQVTIDVVEDTATGVTFF